MEKRPDTQHPLILERDGAILIVRLNRPQHLNAIDRELHDQLERCFSQLPRDDQTAVVVLTGQGRAFSAGGDIREADLRNQGKLVEPLGGIQLRGAARLIRSMIAVPQPIIACVNGDAVGLGATLALMSDIVLATETSRFGDTHVRLGVVAGDGGAVIWPLLMGLNRAKEYLLTGRMLAANEAERLGLVNHVHSPDSLWNETLALATELAAGPREAIQWTKLALNKVVWERANLLLELSLALEAISVHSDDHKRAADQFFRR